MRARARNYKGFGRVQARKDLGAEVRPRVCVGGEELRSVCVCLDVWVCGEEGSGTYLREMRRDFG